MEFCEVRYSQKMIEHFNQQQSIALRHGGDVKYFAELTAIWVARLARLTREPIASARNLSSGAK